MTDGWTKIASIKELLSEPKRVTFKLNLSFLQCCSFLRVYCCSKCSNSRELHKPISPSGVPSLLSRLTQPEAPGHVICHGPITGQYSGHVISTDQLELPGLVTSSLRALGSRSCPGPGAGDAHCQGFLQRISELIVAQN